MDNNLQFNNESQNTAPSNKQDITKIAVIAGAAVVVLVIIIALFSALFGSSYKDAIKDQVKLINKKTEDALPYYKHGEIPEYVEYRELICEYSDDYYEDNYEGAYEDYIDVLKDEFGDNFKVKYKITDSKKMDKDDIEDILDYFEDAYEDTIDDADDTWDYAEEYLEDEYDLSSKELKKVEKAWEKYIKALEEIKISKAYEVEMEFTIKGSEDDDDFDTECIIAKVNGEWVFITELGSGSDKMYWISEGITPSGLVYELDLEVED